MAARGQARELAVTLLTGGGDRPYAYGIGMALQSKGVRLDFVGSDDLDFPEFHGKSNVNFLNLRGDQNPNVRFLEKAFRVLRYYVRLIRYTAKAQPAIFHILWNNKFEYFDRTLLMLYYRFLGKKIALTLHNVNTARRDSRDSFLNRLTLHIQYRFADHIFVHTNKMKQELLEEFPVPEAKATVIPFGINNSLPETSLNREQARQRLGLRNGEKAILFFGNIAPYKGLEYLVSAFQQLRDRHPDYRLVITGKPKNCAEYWSGVQRTIQQDVPKGRILVRPDYIPDEETEVYFKAADVLVLPYRRVYQSGVLFVGYNFGLPALAADVGSLKEEIVEGKTGFVFRPEDPADLARVIEAYFASDLFAELSKRRQEIRDYAKQRYSWDIVSQLTMEVYRRLLGGNSREELSDRGDSSVSLPN